MSALHAACYQIEKRGCDDDTFPDIVKMLVAHGANVNAHLSQVKQVCSKCSWCRTLFSQIVRELLMCQPAKSMLMHPQIVYRRH